MIKICSAIDCSKLLEKGELKDYYIISIRDNISDIEYIYQTLDDNINLCKSMFKVTFVDSNNPFINGSPTYLNVKNILDWTKDKCNENIIVHCTMGISRSSAIAYLINYQRLQIASHAIELLDPKRHAPNKLICRHGVTYFGNTEIFDKVQLFYTKILCL
jgi:protein-tyrosine phosphatase